MRGVILNMGIVHLTNLVADDTANFSFHCVLLGMVFPIFRMLNVGDPNSTKVMDWPSSRYPFATWTAAISLQQSCWASTARASTNYEKASAMNTFSSSIRRGMFCMCVLSILAIYTRASKKLHTKIFPLLQLQCSYLVHQLLAGCLLRTLCTKPR